MASTDYDELMRDLAEADRMGDTELANMIADRIRSGQGSPALNRDQTLKAMQNADPKLGFARAALNAPGDIKEAAVDAWDMITNPKDTMESAGTMLRASRGDIDPRAAMAVQQGVQDIAEDPIETMIQNPFDTAMMFGGGPLMSTLKPIRKTMSGIRKGMGALSDEMYRADMGIPKSTLEVGKDTARHGAREGIVRSRGGLKKAEAARDELNDRLNYMIEEQSDSLNMINRDVIQDHFGDLLNKYAGTPGGNDAIAKLEKQMDKFLADLGDRQMVSAADLHKFKTSGYQQAYKRERIGDLEEKIGPETAGIRSAARGAKDALEARVAGYGEVNDEWAKFAKLKPYVQRAVDQPWPEGVLGKIGKAVESLAPTGSRSAVLLRKMADADIASLVQRYSPQQVKYMLSKVSVDDAAAAAWAAGQYDAILEEG